MKTYKIVNNILGWVIFAVAAFTYCSTIEPTASFWDCPEFISTAAKLEVGHPPGAGPGHQVLGEHVVTEDLDHLLEDQSGFLVLVGPWQDLTVA